MSIIYSPHINLAIYIAPKTGITKLKQLLDEDSPYGSGLFLEIDDGLSVPHADHRILMIRPHTHRVLSTYYDKIVDASGNDGWRHNYSSPNNKQTPYQGFDTFSQFIHSLGLNAWDGHIQPYLCHPISRAALIKDFGVDQKILMQFISTQSIPRDMRHVLNGYLNLDPLYAKEWWEERTQHAIRYSYLKQLPDPSEYGADLWSHVSYEELHRCQCDHGVLPTPDLMYDEETLKLIQSQIGYVCDQIYLHDLNPHATQFFKDEGHAFRI